MSIESKSNEVLWVEKYRPQKIDDTILPEKTKAAFSDSVNVTRGEQKIALFIEEQENSQNKH